MPIGRSSNGLMEVMTIVMVVVFGAVGVVAAQKQKPEPQHKAVFCQCCGQRLSVTPTDPAPPAKPAAQKPRPTKKKNPSDEDALDIVAPFIF